MKKLNRAVIAELIKLKRARILWVTFIAFGIAPIMGGIFIAILGNPDLASNASNLAAKAKTMNIDSSWNSMFGILCQAMGVGGIMIFGFLVSWLFGREYSDGTAKDLLALPVSRIQIINAKFIIYFLWCIALSLSNILLGVLIGLVMGLGGFTTEVFLSNMHIYFVTMILTILIGTPIAFFALWGRGFMAPLGFVALSLVFAQVIAAAGAGNYFPWSVPGLYSGAGGEFKSGLNSLSYIILILMSAAGYFATILWWNLSDQE